MAEARVAVSELNVPPNLDDGRDSWKDVYSQFRKYAKRRYYRTRNSIRNGTWPTSTNNLKIVVALIMSLLLGEPDLTRSLNQMLWSVATHLPLPEGTPRWLKAFFISGLLGLSFFLVLMKVRQYILRMLLSYRGWLYETFKTQSKKTVVWAILVRLISGYQPSLYSCQKSLPRLPVPNLHSTLEKLIESLKPLSTKTESEQLRKEALEFEKGVGSKLQRILVLKSWWASNYVSDWWEKYVYLMTRSPLPINSNYYGMDQSYWSPTEHQTVRAATIIYHILSFKRLIDREELQPLVLRSTIPICMAQYQRLFNTTRIPKKELDVLRHVDSSISRNIVVYYKGLHYSMDAFDSKNQILSPLALYAQLELIVKDAKAELAKGGIPEASTLVSSLTALPRNEWAAIRKSHFRQGINKKSIDAIENSIFVVVLSDATPKTLTERGNQLIHADGKSLWYDKSLNLVFFANGQCGLNGEHSMADAPAMGHCWEYCMTKEIIEKWYTDDGHCMPLPKTFRQGKYKLPHRLTWDISPSLGSEIYNSFQFAQKNNEDLDLEVCDHDKWGKGDIKKCKVSPDAFVQISLQLAYFKDSGSFAQTYEASMTRLYLCGRTETVRSCTQETSDFVMSMVQNNISKEEKIRLFQLAAEKHQQLYRDSMNGKGIDRHLFGLYVASRGFGYKSEFLEKILLRPWTLSTSQQPQQQLMHVPDANLDLFMDKYSPGGGFGPVNDDGYGVSYMLPSDHKIFFHVSSKHSSEKTSSKRFVKNIFQSLEEIRQLFDTVQ